MSSAGRIAFLFVGGVHHVFHTLPVACALSLRSNVEVTAFSLSDEIDSVIQRVLADFPDAAIEVQRLKRFPVLDKLRRPSLSKLPTLWRNRRRLDQFDALVTAECTSIALRRMGLKRPLFICLPHGAGDRAISFEPRFRRFDRVLVAGPKSVRRMVTAGVPASRLREVGYPKAEYLSRRARSRPRPFANDLPIILYNPHFRASLSSLSESEQIVRAITDRTPFNLIVAPHIRAFEAASAADLRRWRSLAVPGRVLVDTGSPQMIDMSHVAIADVYLGDVSSQVYEYLLLGPRPCLFVNAHDVSWRDDPDYAFWHLGEVVSPDDVPSALHRVVQSPGRFQQAQQEAVADTFGNLEGSARRAADAILASLSEPR